MRIRRCGSVKTISQPYIVALMVEAAEVKPSDRVLEIGAGSGYAAAVLAEIAGPVYAIQHHPALAAAGRQRFQKLGYDATELRVGDGTLESERASHLRRPRCRSSSMHGFGSTRPTRSRPSVRNTLNRKRPTLGHLDCDGHARSRNSVTPFSVAQWSQQKNVPAFSRP
jgi:hypothetical protein